VDSGNSEPFCIFLQGLFRVEMTRGSIIEVDKATALEDPIEDGCRHIFVV
jgi:hypothetical protein